MLSNTKNSVSKSIGIWTFILLLIFKSIFIKLADAQLTTLDKCATDPECVATVGSELAPVVSAPTATGLGASTISTTTSIGSTSAVVRTVAGVAITGGTAAGGYGIWQYWNQAQNQQAQKKAVERYCQANSTDEVCLPWYEVWLGATPYNDASDGQYKGVYYAKFRIQGQVTGYRITPYDSDEVLIGVTNEAGDYPARRFYYSPNQTYKILRVFRVDGQRDKLPLRWKNWPQEKRDEAVRLLNPSDWQNFITSMPEGGVLNPGDKIKVPKIIIPGQEKDDPNTPADERLLKKEFGFFTFPGVPDFDKDGIPDATDLDDDNDGILDKNDPNPYNPNIPFASSTPDQSAEVTPEVLQDISDIVSKHPNEKCVECADEIEAYLREQGIHGERIKLDTVKQVKEDNNIYDDSHPPKAAPDYIISENGHHEGIAIKINGEEKVFDNLHPDGVLRQQWMNNLTYHSKIFGGPDFRKSGYLF